MDVECDQLMGADCLSLCAPHAKNTRVSQEGNGVGWRACVWAEVWQQPVPWEVLREPSTIGARTQHMENQALQPLTRGMVSCRRMDAPGGV